MTKLGKNLVYMKREFVRVFLKVFQERDSMYLDHSITLFIESYLHVHPNLRSPNTLQIPFKFVGLCTKHPSLAKLYIDTQYSTNSNMYFSIK